MTFRAKPSVTIEAEQFFSDKPLPFRDRGPFVAFDHGSNAFYVITANGNQIFLDDGDWVILEKVDGHYAYAMKPAVFNERWELAEG